MKLRSLDAASQKLDAVSTAIGQRKLSKEYNNVKPQAWGILMLDNLVQ
jgi:hypothetical protein